MQITNPAMLGFGLLASAQNLKFMPFGDSITEATCWRAKVQDQLAEAGLSDEVDFVGGQSDNMLNCTTESGTFDAHHEGHSGWTAVAIAEDWIDKWAVEEKPDIVNFHLGTNDVRKGATPEDVIEAYDTILKALRAANPKIKVIIDKLIALPEQEEAVKEINDAIPAWAKKNTSKKSPIAVADCSAEAGYKKSFNKDGIHPNDAGDEFMASKIGPILAKYIDGAV